MIRLATGIRPEELQPGTGRSLTLQGAPIALYNLDGALYAVDNRCPHRGSPLVDGVWRNGHVTCTWHGWRFNLQDGSCDMNTLSTLKRYTVIIEDGRVVLETDALPAPPPAEEEPAGEY